jgi:glycosyltransferase involved in cell wall biosynthesis
MKILLVAEEVPDRQQTGALVVGLRPFIDYCAARGAQLTILVTGHRFDWLVMRARRIFPHAKPRVVGPALVQIGPWILVVDPRSWRHTIFTWIMRKGGRRLGSALLQFRSRIKGHTAIIGRWLGAHEARRLAATIRAADPDIMLVNTIFATAILEVKPARTRAAVITHDVFHQRTSAFEARGLAVKPAVTQAQEAELLRRFDAIIAVSDEDAREFRRLAPNTLTVVVTPRAPDSSTVARRPDARRCVFLGTSYALNVDGITWFLSMVWPNVIASAPDARLELIGSVCNAVSVEDSTLIKRFIVEDLGPALAGASFAVNPLRAGSGLKIKMLDYFAHGVPAITTSTGAAGFPRNGAEPFVVCDEAAEFAEAVLGWLRDPSIAALYAARCRAYVELFSGESSFAELDRALGLGTDESSRKTFKKC